VAPSRRIKVLLICNREIHDWHLTDDNRSRLQTFVDLEWLESSVTGFDWVSVPDAPEVTARIVERAGDVDAILVCHGAPRIGAEVMDAAPRLTFIGELTGDRFAARIDSDAAVARGIRVVDTTNGSSYPVAEWALGMILITLRNAGAQFRHLIGDGVYRRPRSDPGYLRGELTGKRVGLIGCGIIGRRLLELLQPFRCAVRVYDPYLPKEIADVYGFLLTSLDNVLSQSEVIVSLVPLTPRTRGMIGRRELALIRPGGALVNVSRGMVIDSDALVERLRQGDITAALDVFDPEPIPAGHPIRDLPNVFLTPHIAGVSLENGPRCLRLMLDELDRFFSGHETLYDITPRVLANRRGEPWLPNA
jgi:phosphoglycerate dehydrogenase-like enzyme